MSLRFGVCMEEQEALQLNALQLAYLGDSVWELIVRYGLSIQKLNVNHMHKDCVKMVNARSQSQLNSTPKPIALLSFGFSMIRQLTWA